MWKLYGIKNVWENLHDNITQWLEVLKKMTLKPYSWWLRRQKIQWLKIFYITFINDY